MTEIANGQWLRQSRQQLGLTLQELADHLKMTGKRAADHLRHMEKGRRNVPGPIMVAVEQMLQNGKV